MPNDEGVMASTVANGCESTRRAYAPARDPLKLTLPFKNGVRWLVAATGRRRLPADSGLTELMLEWWYSTPSRRTAVID
jgi:hypothetical protein